MINKHIEIKLSKSNHPIPVVDSIHLHSIYNPHKEAEAFALNNEKKISENNHLLIFGLAFGYHLEAIEKRMKHHYGNNYEITVIEPSEGMYDRWKEERPSKISSHVRVASYGDMQSYFEDKLLVEFLTKKPSIISHTSSFQLHEKFFKEFMSFSYAPDTYSSAQFVENQELKNYLQDSEMESTDELIEASNSKENIKKWDFFTLALNEITKNS